MPAGAATTCGIMLTALSAVQTRPVYPMSPLMSVSNGSSVKRVDWSPMSSTM